MDVNDEPREKQTRTVIIDDDNLSPTTVCNDNPMQQINLSNANSAIENIPNNCDMCASLKLNAERAWSVTITYADIATRLNKRDKENAQLKRINEDNQAYINEQQRINSELKEQLSSKNQTISRLEENLEMMRNQYYQILEKAGESKVEIQEWKTKYEKSQELLSVINERRKKTSRHMQQAVKIASMYKKKLQALQEETSSSEGHPSTSSNARIQDSHTIHVQCSPKGIDKTFDGSEEIQEMNFDVDEPTDLIIDCESESESSPEVEINTVNTFTKQQANVSRVNTQQDFSKATLSNSSLTLCEAKMATIKKAFDTPFFHELKALSFITPLTIHDKPSPKKAGLIVKDLGIKKEHLYRGQEKLAIRDIVHATGVTKGEASLQAVHAFRVHAGIDQTEDRFARHKDKVHPDQMPWQPRNKVLTRKSTPNSILDKRDHLRYNSIVINLLKSEPKFRHTNNKIELKAMDEKLASERDEFERVALERANLYKPLPYTHVKAHSTLFKNAFKIRLQREVENNIFDICVDKMQWFGTGATGLSSNIRGFLRADKVLAPGLLHKIELPNIRRRFQFEHGSRQLNEMLQKPKVAIDSDEIAMNYALENDIEFLMDAGTAKNFLSGSFPLRSEDYATQIKIVRKLHAGTVKRLCIANRPVLASKFCLPRIGHSVVKWAAKYYLLEQQQSDCGKNLAGIETKGVKRYATINIGSENSFPVLIRSTNHGEVLEYGCDVPSPISITTKAEFIPEVGAERLHPEEEISNFLTAFLKGALQNINLRIEPYNLNCLQLEYKNEKTMSSKFSPGTTELLSTRLHRFYALLQKLKSLNFGTYLLVTDQENEELLFYRAADEAQHSGSTTECLKSGKNGQHRIHETLHQRVFSNQKSSSPHTNVKSYWHGLDPHVPLIWHIVQKRIPGSFYPSE